MSSAMPAQTVTTVFEGNSNPVEKLDEDTCFIAASSLMREVRARVELVARVNIPVLLLGETGVGKDVVARLIHRLSARAHRPFGKLNCAAVPEELLESELLGYEPGAFTGAMHSKPGHFELCEGGTVFLDEIGEMSPRLQAKLLHVLQDKKFYRLGGRRIVSVDVRVLAATNVDIENAIRQGELREDLYYRLSAFTIHIPPLRERRDEIPLLFRHFMNRFAACHALAPRSISTELFEALMAYSWPGNVRQLENLARRYLILGDEAAILAELSPGKAPSTAFAPEITECADVARDLERGLKCRVKSVRRGVEMHAITEALERSHWNRTLAAKLLNISTRSLRYKMSQYGIHANGAGEVSCCSG